MVGLNFLGCCVLGYDRLIFLMPVYRPIQVPSQPSRPNMERLYRNKLANMSAGDMITLRTNIEELHELTCGKITVATGCSCTDVVIYGLEVMIVVWADVFGISFKLDHKFSAENVDWKVDFIAEHFTPDAIFPDATKLHQDCAVGASDGEVSS